MGGEDSKMTKKEKVINNLSVPGNNTSTTNLNLSKESDTSESRGDDDIDYFDTQKRLYYYITSKKKKMSCETAELSARFGVSATKQMAMTAKLIKLSGGKLSDVTLSKASAVRHRRSEITAAEIKSELLAKMPDYLVLH